MIWRAEMATEIFEQNGPAVKGVSKAALKSKGYILEVLRNRAEMSPYREQTDEWLRERIANPRKATGADPCARR